MTTAQFNTSLQSISPIFKNSHEYQRPVIRLYGIAGHGKGEVDHVGGVAKVAVWDETACGTISARSSETVPMLTKKFGDKERMKYHIVEIKTRSRSREKILSKKEV